MLAAVTSIGSDMESVSAHFLATGKVPPPWETGAPIQYVETGRQALYILSERLWTDGRRTLIVPEFLCDSMITSFLQRPWNLVPMPTCQDFNLDLLKLEHMVKNRSHPFVMLSALYFGKKPTQEYGDTIRAAQDSGGVVIDDETHGIFQAGHSPADYAVGSLRKLLPVAGGAYVRGAVDDFPELEEASNFSRDRWEAMEEKARYIKNGTPLASKIHQKFKRANAGMEASLVASKMDSRSQDAITTFNYTEMAGRRIANEAHLRTLLHPVPGVEVVRSASAGGVPSHLVLRTKKRDDMQAYLAHKNIFCPIHWDQSAYLRSNGAWPDSQLSVPIDHRYGEKEMTYIARSIRNFASNA